MKHSIFWKLIILILPLVLATDAVILGAAYKITYDANIEHCRKDVKETSSVAASIFEIYDPDDLQNTKLCCKDFDTLCSLLNMTYIYAIKPDLEKNELQYLAIGFGSDATDSAKKTRYTGVVVDGIYEEEKKAFTEGESVFRVEKNEFGETITCYTPVKHHWNPEKNDYDEDTVSFVGAEMSIKDVMNTVHNQFLTIMIFVLLSTMLIVIAIAVVFKTNISKRAKLLSRRMTEFVADRDKDFEEIKFKGKDELSEMATAFNSMAYEIDRYISDISELNKQKLTQETELNIAKNIQMGLLAPAAFSCSAAEINAFMRPTRDVGGDLYDYHVLNNGKVCILIADVSGKGVSAALFMSRAITLLHQYVEMGMSPAKVLYEYNNHLADHNPNILFITTFVGIYDPKTKELTYSNAGHNNPYLLSDKLTALDSARGMAAGIFRKEIYEECTVKLKPGDTVFLFTDGVTEAESKDKKMFGDEGLENVLGRNLGKSGKEITDSVLAEINDFTKDAAQNDDITILAMTVIEKKTLRVKTEAKKENLVKITDCLQKLGLSEDASALLRLMAEEMFVNICSYAYPDGKGEAEFIAEADSDKAALTFIDSGKPFDPTKDVLEIDNYDAENAIGGLGRFLTFELADGYEYEYRDGKNILRLEKKL